MMGFCAMRLARFKEMKERGFFNDRVAAARAIERGFPAPRELGPNTIAWDLDEAEAYVASRPRRVPTAKASAPSAKRGRPAKTASSELEGV
jgi:predicted DNA-binding transcriptional regulator AlpA